MNIVPVLLIKNEEVWIRRILSALANVFPRIIVSDTGSTDSTISEVLQIPEVALFQFKNVSPVGLRECRQFMQEKAAELFGATHIFLVDGDELYPTTYLRAIAAHPMPDNAISGFTSGIEVGEREDGELWFYGMNGEPVGLNRQAIIPVTSKWRGEYPFESPDCYQPGSPLNHYFPIPAGSHGFYHLHHTRRSRKDAEVYLRSAKSSQFSMREVPQFVLYKLWLQKQEDYQDE